MNASSSWRRVSSSSVRWRSSSNTSQHLHERYIECDLQHRAGLREHGRLDVQPLGAVAQARPSAASRQRRQRLVTSCSGAARWAPAGRRSATLRAGLEALLGTAAGHPAGDGDRRDRADSLEAFFHERRVEHVARLRRSRDGLRENLVAAIVQRFAEQAQMVGGRRCAGALRGGRPARSMPTDRSPARLLARSSRARWTLGRASAGERRAAASRFASHLSDD